MNFYIVSFDRQPNVSYKPFHDKFVKHPNIQRWCHYIKSSYIIGTDLSVSDLSKHYASTAKSLGMVTTHLVLKVDLSSRQGLLPKASWDWFKRNSEN